MEMEGIRSIIRGVRGVRGIITVIITILSQWYRQGGSTWSGDKSRIEVFVVVVVLDHLIATIRLAARSSCACLHDLTQGHHAHGWRVKGRLVVGVRRAIFGQASVVLNFNVAVAVRAMIMVIEVVILLLKRVVRHRWAEQHERREWEGDRPRCRVREVVRWVRIEAVRRTE